MTRGPEWHPGQEAVRPAASARHREARFADRKLHRGALRPAAPPGAQRRAAGLPRRAGWQAARRRAGARGFRQTVPGRPPWGAGQRDRRGEIRILLREDRRRAEQHRPAGWHRRAAGWHRRAGLPAERRSPAGIRRAPAAAGRDAAAHPEWAAAAAHPWRGAAARRAIRQDHEGRGLEARLELAALARRASPCEPPAHETLSREAPERQAPVCEAPERGSPGCGTRLEHQAQGTGEGAAGTSTDPPGSVRHGWRASPAAAPPPRAGARGSPRWCWPRRCACAGSPDRTPAPGDRT